MAIPTKEVARGIFRIGYLDTGGASRESCPFLVVGKEQAMIVEPGEEGQVDALVEGIKQCGVDLNRVAYIWASHLHLHHVQGVPELLKRLPKATFLVHPFGVPHLIDPTRLSESTIQVWGANCYRPMAPTPKDRITAVSDRQVIDLGRRELEIIWAPGHAPHHMGLFDRQAKVLFPGDLGPGAGSFGGPGGSSPTEVYVDTYVDSIRRFETYNPSMILIFGREEPIDPTVLSDAEVDMMVYHRLCLEGMRQKVSMDEITRRMREFQKWARTERWEELQGREGQTDQQRRMRQGRPAPPQIIGYILKKHPELEMPSGDRSKNAREMRESE